MHLGNFARVRAVSVSVPRLVEIHGRPISTSIVHDAHPGPLAFGAGGPAGNSTAVHTEDVLAMPAEHYDYWARELGVERSAWGDCHFGENLMLFGLNEHSLRVGDRLSIGPTALFEVTSPRIPCFKLSWRLGQPESFLKRLVDSGLTGFYLRVLRAGEVGPGDAVTFTSTNEHSIGVAALSQLLSDESADLTRLRAAIASPGLGHQASTMLRDRITRITDGERCRIGRWSGWRAVQIARIDAESAGVRSFVLRPKSDERLADYRAGQFLSVRFAGPDGRKQTRTWSLSDYAEGGPSYRISVLRVGSGSGHWHERMRVGDTVEIRSPQGSFTLDRATPFRVVLISAGIGVTPLLSMLKAHACRPDPPPLLWIHSARDGAAHALRSDAERVLGSNALFRSHIVYTAPRPEDRPGVDFQSGVRLTQERLGELLGTSYVCRPFGREIEIPSYAGAFYLCGPKPFEEMVHQALMNLGVPASHIQSEQFGRHSADTPSGLDRAEVRFVRSGKVAEWTAESDLSLLDLAELQDIDAPFSCRAGTCHTCAVHVRRGAVRYALAPTVPPALGEALICCARPDSTTLELDL
jgi:ferredoxin-NADP reductase/MOSC domain-containing protein YiiM